MRVSAELPDTGTSRSAYPAIHLRTVIEEMAYHQGVEQMVTTRPHSSLR